MEKLYFCVGCRQVHYDNDYCKEDGDLIITDWDRFLDSIEQISEIEGISPPSFAQGNIK